MWLGLCHGNWGAATSDDHVHPRGRGSSEKAETWGRERGRDKTREGRDGTGRETCGKMKRTGREMKESKDTSGFPPLSLDAL